MLNEINEMNLRNYENREEENECISKCLICHEEFCEDEMREGICDDCLEKNCTIENGMKFLEYADLEYQFYVQTYFNAECSSIMRYQEFIEMCRDKFIKNHESDYKGDAGSCEEIELHDFIMDNIENLTEFAYYLVNNIYTF